MISEVSDTPKSIRWLSLALFSLFLAACQTTIGDIGPSINTRAPVKVALLIPGGSAQPGDVLLARHFENAARLAISGLDGAEVDLRVYNTAGQATLAAEAAMRAANDGAQIILGPLYAEAANAAGVAVSRRNINVLAFSNNSAIAGGNVFILGSTFQNSADRLVRYANSRGKGRIMVVHAQSTSGEAGRNAVQRAISRSGATLAATASHEFSQNGVVQAIPTIASTARSSGANAIFFTSDTSGALPLLTQLLTENRVDPLATQFIGLTRWDIPAATLTQKGVQGGWFAKPDPALVAQFRARYQSTYGEPPHPLAGLAFDGIAAIGALVQTGNSNALTRSSLTQGSGFVGTQGVFRFLPDGTNQRGLAVVQIQNGQVVVIDPAPRSFGGAGF